MKPVKLKPWDKLSREEQDLYLRILWNDDYSEKAIADFLKATKGQIVRRRQLELKIPTGERGKVKSSVIPERFFDLLDIHKMDEMAENGVTPIAPVERTEEVSPRVQEPERPAKERVAQTNVLPLHKPEVRAKRERAPEAVRVGTEVVRQKLAASEATQCTHEDADERRCAYEWSDSITRRCTLHPK